MTFRPSAALAPGTGYTASVGTGARDAAGNGMAAAQASSFATAATTTPTTPTTPTTVTAYPYTTVIESGSLRSGSYSRLASDDNVFYEVSSTTSSTRTTSWYGVTSGVSNDLRSLRVAYSGRNSLTCSQTVSVWNWTTGAWVQLDARSVGATEALVDKTVGGTLAAYVSGTAGDGEVRVRVRCTHSSSAFYARADLLRVSYTR